MLYEKQTYQAVSSLARSKIRLIFLDPVITGPFHPNRKRTITIFTSPIHRVIDHLRSLTMDTAPLLTDLVIFAIIVFVALAFALFSWRHMHRSRLYHREHIPVYNTGLRDLELGKRISSTEKLPSYPERTHQVRDRPMYSLPMEEQIPPSSYGQDGGNDHRPHRPERPASNNIADIGSISGASEASSGLGKPMAPPVRVERVDKGVYRTPTILHDGVMETRRGWAPVAQEQKDMGRNGMNGYRPEWI